MRIVPTGNLTSTRDALNRRNMYIRRFLCTEQELAQEGSSAADLLGEANTRDYLSKNPNKKKDLYERTIRVLPGVGLLQGHLLQAFSSRGFKPTKGSGQLATSTGGSAKGKILDNCAA